MGKDGRSAEALEAFAGSGGGGIIEDADEDVDKDGAAIRGGLLDCAGVDSSEREKEGTEDDRSGEKAEALGVVCSSSGSVI